MRPIKKALALLAILSSAALELNIDPKTGKPFKDLEMRKTRIANFEIKYK